jgi:hypothetical protein
MRKSVPSIKEAVKEQFKFLPDIFRGYDLVKVVKIVTRRKYVYQDSVFRKMRLLRKEGKLNYKILGSKEDSLYQKICLPI